MRNPNPFPIVDAWMTIEGPMQELSRQAFELGALEAEGRVTVDVEADPPPGLSAGEIPVLVHVASQLRPLASQRAILRAREHIPDLEIQVVRQEESVHVHLLNRGETDAGRMRIQASEAFKTLDGLEAGATETTELPLAGKVRHVVITLYGPSAQRSVLIPLPDVSVAVAPPRLRLSRTGLLGFHRVRLEATDPGGLHEGWISLDGEKKSYVDWTGRRSGTLSAPLSQSQHSVVTRIENTDGVAVIDRRTLTID